MGTSSITITSLTATPSLRGNKLAAVVSASGPAANIPSLMLDTVEFYSSIANDFSTATKVAEGKPEELHAGLVEEQTYYYWGIPRAVNGSKGAMYPPSPTGGVACKAIGMSGLAFGLANGELVASVAGNALTIALKTSAGNDPSTSDPVYVAIRDGTLTHGNYNIKSITAALSLVITAGSYFGQSNNVPFRIWIVLFDDAGTARLGAVSFTNLFAVGSFSDAVLHSSSTPSGSGGNAGTIYTGTAVTSRPMRILGYMEWNSGMATTGQWTVGPDVIGLVTSATKLPGEQIGYVGVGTTPTSGTTVFPVLGSTPQNTHGNDVGSFLYTPTSAINFIELEYRADCALSVGGLVALAAFRSTNASAFAVACATVPSANARVQLSLKTAFQALSASQINFQFRAGGTVAGTFTEGDGGALFGIGLTGFMGLREIVG